MTSSDDIEVDSTTGEEEFSGTPTSCVVVPVISSANALLTTRERILLRTLSRYDVGEGSTGAVCSCSTGGGVSSCGAGAGSADCGTTTVSVSLDEGVPPPTKSEKVSVIAPTIISTKDPVTIPVSEADVVLPFSVITSSVEDATT